MAELHHTVASSAWALGGHHPMPTGRDGAVAEPLQHQAGVEDHPALRGRRRQPGPIHQHLQASGGSAGQGGDQVDVGMGGGPEVAAWRRLGHGGIANRPAKGGGVLDHLLKEGFGAAHRQGNRPQEAALQIGDGGMEALQHHRDAWNNGLGQQRLRIQQRETAPQGVVRRQRRRPIEHFLPIGFGRSGGGFNQQAGVAALAMAAGHAEAGLAGRLEGEELLQQAVGAVEQVGGQIAAGVHEAGGEAAPHPIHHRSAGGAVAPLEAQQVDIEDGRIAHGRWRGNGRGDFR